MATEDNFLRLNEEYSLGELEKRTYDGEFSLDEIKSIFLNGNISLAEYLYCFEILERNINA